jgi:glycopeptide antibiotics resistance protein
MGNHIIENVGMGGSGTNPPSAPQPRPILRRGQCALLTALFLVFLVYGSLVPLHLMELSWADAWQLYQKAAHGPVIASKSDFVANVMLYVPQGFIVMATLAVDRRWFWGFLFAPFALAFCSATSMAIEFTQLFFPPRTTALSDVISNTLGSGMGVFLWLVCGPLVIRWCRLVWTAQLGGGLANLFLPGYLFVLFVLSQLPPDWTISPVELYHKYKKGMVRLVPFAPIPGTGIYDQIEEQLWNIAYFYPVGLLLAFRQDPRWRQPRAWPWVFGFSLLVAVTIECLQMFNLSRFFDASDIVSGTLSALVGWASGVAVASRWGAGQPESPEVRGRFSLWWLVAATFLWLGMVFFVEWHPFDFSAKLHLPTTWLPFVDYYGQHNYFQALDQFVRKVLLFLPGGIVLALSLSGRRAAGWRAVLLALMIATIAEAGQIFLKDRYCSLTDVIVMTIGGWLGYLVGRHMNALMPGFTTPSSLATDSP